MSFEEIKEHLEEHEKSAKYLSPKAEDRPDLQWLKQHCSATLEYLRDPNDERADTIEHVFCRWMVIWGLDIVRFQKAGAKFRCNHKLQEPPLKGASRKSQAPLDVSPLFELLYKTGAKIIIAVRNNPQWAPNGLNHAGFFVPKLTAVLRQEGYETRVGVPQLDRLKYEIRELDEQLAPVEINLDRAFEAGNDAGIASLLAQKDRLEAKLKDLRQKVVRILLALSTGKSISLDEPTGAAGGSEEGDVLPLIAIVEDEPTARPGNVGPDARIGKKPLLPDDDPSVVAFGKYLGQQTDGEMLVAVVDGLNGTLGRRTTKGLLAKLAQSFPPKERWDEDFVKCCDTRAYRHFGRWFEESKRDQEEL